MCVTRWCEPRVERTKEYMYLHTVCWPNCLVQLQVNALMAGEPYRGGQAGALQNKSTSQSACIRCLSTPGFSPDRVSCTLPLPLWLKTIPALVKNK